MNELKTNQIYKEIGTHMYPVQFLGYWILAGENEKGSIYKKAFDKNRDFTLHSKDCGYFRYNCNALDEFTPVTEEEAEFVNGYFADHPDDLQAFHHSTQAYTDYRSALLTAGFTEAPKGRGHFYRANTENTAFIVNLIDEGYGVTAVYGFTLNSFMGDSSWFLDNGEDSDTCKLRESVFLITGEENLQAKDTIGAFYKTYCKLEKDALLAVAKDKQKAFLNRFAVCLKPLGFKKKGTKWTKILPSQFQITFHAQKSSYSDQYYFRYYVDPPEGSGIKLSPRESYGGVSINETGIFNWQLMSEAQIESLLNIVIHQHILPLCEKYS